MIFPPPKSTAVYWPIVKVYCFNTVAAEYALWCWEKEVLEVTVDHVNNPTALNFVQVGFRLEIAVPVNITLVSCLSYDLPNAKHLQAFPLPCILIIIVIKCMPSCWNIFTIFEIEILTIFIMHAKEFNSCCSLQLQILCCPIKISVPQLISYFKILNLACNFRRNQVNGLYRAIDILYKIYSIKFFVMFCHSILSHHVVLIVLVIHVHCQCYLFIALWG